MENQAVQIARVTNPIAPGLSGIYPDFELSALIKVIITALFFIGALMFMIMFIVGGIKWITSGGDKTQLESARTTILNALVGFIILFSLFAILSLIGNLFGINIFELKLQGL